MIDLKITTYRVFRAIVPLKIAHRLGRSPLLRRFRDRFFRPTGVPEIIRDMVEWEDYQFQFGAPYQSFFKAQTRGIENGICRLGRSVFEPNSVAIDVGASYGFITLILAKSAQQNARVISFEIDPYVCHVLNDNIEINGLSDVCIVVNQGAGAEDSEGFVTVDTIINQHRSGKVTFIKIDVDGGDYEVLLGARHALREYRPVVVMEMTQQPQAIYELLVSSGYNLFIDQTGQPVKPGVWPPNLIASVNPIMLPSKGDFLTLK